MLSDGKMSQFEAVYLSLGHTSDIQNMIYSCYNIGRVNIQKYAYFYP